MALMSHLPDVVFAQGAQTRPRFTDMAAGTEVMNARSSSRFVEMPANGPRRYRSWLDDFGFHQDWTGQVGFAITEIIASADTGDLRNRGLVLQLSPGAMKNVPPALLADGYTAGTTAPFPTFWRGVNDLAEDRTNRHPRDPFAFPLARSSRIAVDGDFLFHGNSLHMLSAMLTQQPTAVLETFGQVIDAPEWGPRKLIEATIFSDPAQFAPDVLFTRLASRFNAKTDRMPYWRNLMFAALSDGPNDLTLIAVLYDSHAEAAQAAQFMQERLPLQPQLKPNTVLGDLIGMEGKSMVIGDGPFAAVYATETLPEDDKIPNISIHAYSVLLFNLAIGDLAFFAPSVK